MAQHSHAGQPARLSDLTNIPRLVSAYYLNKPDMSRPEQRVAFGTSGHRGSALHNAFTESHILAVTQALVEYRQQAGITPRWLRMAKAEFRTKPAPTFWELRAYSWLLFQAPMPQPSSGFSATICAVLVYM